MKSARTKACEIPLKVKQEVGERDNYTCIISGKPGIPDAHFIPRSLGGMGIPQNVVTLAPDIHRLYDNGSVRNGNLREQIKSQIRDYLQNYYGDEWKEEDLYYDKSRRWAQDTSAQRSR
jgi:5-methylcytosine-specific restriction endonuclease McrA